MSTRVMSGPVRNAKSRGQAMGPLRSKVLSPKASTGRSISAAWDALRACRDGGKRQKALAVTWWSPSFPSPSIDNRGSPVAMLLIHGRSAVVRSRTSVQHSASSLRRLTLSSPLQQAPFKVLFLGRDAFSSVVLNELLDAPGLPFPHITVTRAYRWSPG
jgi:hypothetical protein